MRAARRLATLLAGYRLAALVATLALMVKQRVGRPLTDYGVNGVFGLVAGRQLSDRRLADRVAPTREPDRLDHARGGLSQSAEALATNYAVYGLETVHAAIPLVDLAAWVEVWAWAPGFLLLGIIVLLFPDGELPSPRLAPVPWIAGCRCS